MIHRLFVQDFRALSGKRTFDLPSGVTAIVGRNEVGKSSLVNAIAWAFFGTDAMPNGISSADIVSHGAKEARVVVSFALHGDEYELTRTQKSSGLGDAKILRNGGELAIGRESVTKAAADLLGIDRDGFLVSVFARQDELDALAGKQGAQRVSTVLRLLGIEQLNIGIKVVRADLNEERKKLDLSRAGIPDRAALGLERVGLQDSLFDLMVQTGKLEAAVAASSDKAAALRQRQQALQPQRAAYAAWQQRFAAAERDLALAQGRLVAVPPEPHPPMLDEPPVADEAALSEAQEQVASLREAHAVCKSRNGELTVQLQGLTEVCPTCKRPFADADEVAARRAELAAELSQSNRDLLEIEADGHAARGALTLLELEQAQAHRVTAANLAQQTAYDAAVDRRQAAEQQAVTAAAAYDAARTAAQSVLAEQPHSSDLSEQEATISDALYAAQALLSTDQDALAQVRSRIAADEAGLARVDAAIAAASAAYSVSQVAEQRAVTLDTTVTEMVKLKERLIGRIIPTLQERASVIVSEMTDGKHTELALTADYEIQYRNEAGELRSFANLSGGAQRVFALALRLAIADLRAGSVPFLALDEVFESLDDERQALAWEAIERLTRRYPQVLLITHVAQLRDRAPHVVAL